jgi:hypothetical protein
MADDRIVYRPTNLAQEAARVRDYCRQASERTAEALRISKPDTFLGRKTHEPFPKQDEE